ncbi:hypothetical protein BGZ95_006709, partial [Linnemannia exigua]
LSPDRLEQQEPPSYEDFSLVFEEGRENPFSQTWRCQIEEQITSDEIGRVVILNRPTRLVVWCALVCTHDETSCSS